MERTDQQATWPTPVTADAHATAPQLLARARADYQAAAWKRATETEGDD